MVSAALSLSLHLRKKTVAVSNCHDTPEGAGVRTFLWGKLFFLSDYLVCKICVQASLLYGKNGICQGRKPALSGVYYLYSLKTVIPEFAQQISGIPALYPDHTRNGVKCHARTFCPAWFTPFLAWFIMQNSKYTRKNEM